MFVNHHNWKKNKSTTVVYKHQLFSKMQHTYSKIEDDDDEEGLDMDWEPSPPERHIEVHFVENTCSLCDGPIAYDDTCHKCDRCGDCQQHCITCEGCFENDDEWCQKCQYCERCSVHCARCATCLGFVSDNTSIYCDECLKQV